MKYGEKTRNWISMLKLVGQYCNVHPTRCNVTQFIFLETALHVSGGTPTQLYLQHLVFITPLLLTAATPPTTQHSTLKPVPTLPQ